MSGIQKMTVAEFHSALKAQGVSAREHLALKCPICGTVQSMHDLIRAGAGKNADDVESFFGWSCIGRWNDAGPYKPKARKKQFGCDWTLGGLFQLHKLVVVTEDGKEHPRFEVATPAEALAHENTAKVPA